MGGFCQGRPAICMIIHTVVDIPRQGRLEACYRMYAAKHLICRLEGV